MQVYAKITQKRYRDVSVVVRSAALDGLSKIMLALPETYVQVVSLTIVTGPLLQVGAVPTWKLVRPHRNL